MDSLFSAKKRNFANSSQKYIKKMNNDTICAPATAMGGAIGIIRVSGEQAIEIASSIFSSDLTNAQPNNVIFGRILSPPPTGGGQGEALARP